MQNKVGDTTERLAGHNSAGRDLFIIIPTLMLELGAGSLTLPPPAADGSPDLAAMPVIEMGWLADEADRVRLRDALRLALRLAASDEMAEIIDAPIVPTPDVLTAESSDAEIDAWVAANVITSHHQSSTCRMGDASDAAVVCDEEGRVHHTQGLRVVDASIMPDCPRANTQATTYMIAERISGIIKHGSLEAALVSAVRAQLAVEVGAEP